MKGTATVLVQYHKKTKFSSGLVQHNFAFKNGRGAGVEACVYVTVCVTVCVCVCVLV